MSLIDGSTPRVSPRRMSQTAREKLALTAASVAFLFAIAIAFGFITG